MKQKLPESKYFNYTIIAVSRTCINGKNIPRHHRRTGI